ncbi:MAG: response regulator transcription factor [Clostridia bacterium]|nr:response regulator transcription factor [Clostridia bacterium]MBQ8912173.1 response regulator transcription factor [Clostridia bacterium]
MTYRIALCDDEPAQREYLEKKLSLFARARRVQFGFAHFSSAEAFLFCFRENRNIDLLFLDIEMAEMNGIELAKELRKEQDALQIVFITGYPDYVGQGYDVEALHYLLKPVSTEKLFEVCDRFLKTAEEQPRFYLFPAGKEVVRLYEKEILYGESEGHYVILHTKTEELKLRMTVPELEKRLGEGFFRPSRSFVVNLRYVTRIAKTEMLLENGASIPLGKGAFDEANRALIAFLREL